jgi:hypothetical protein
MPVRILPAALVIALLLGACSRDTREKQVAEHETMCWRLIDTEDGPAARFDQAMTVDRGAKKIYLHGGRGEQAHFFSDFWSFDPGKSEWRKLETGGGPSGRSGHSLAIDPDANRLLLFGGFNFNASGETAFLRDLWIYTGDEGWSREYFSSGPRARAWHAALVTQEAMVIFGGFGGPPHYYLQDIWSLSLSDLTFRRIATDGGPLMAGSPALLDKGGVSSLVAFSPSSILVFGRSGASQTAPAGLWSLQVEMDDWTTIEAGTPPDDDFTFAMTDEESKALMVVRGPTEEEIESGDQQWTFWVLDHAENEWKTATAEGGPSTSHRLNCAPNPGLKHGWICFGGARKKKISDETWSLSPCVDGE